MRTWHVLAIGGAAGVLSLLLVPFETLVPRATIPAWELRLLCLIQPAILVGIAVAAGAMLAPSLGLGAPLATALAEGRGAGSVLRRQIGPALLSGVAVALVLIGYARLTAPWVASSSGLAQRIASFDPPLVTRLLYGGIAEELLTRWGLVSLFAWVLWRLAHRPSMPSAWIFRTAIALGAALFAAGHLPLLFALGSAPPAWIIAAALIGNFAPGLLFGWLFWRRGLEAAMIAHATAHLVAWCVV